MQVYNDLTRKKEALTPLENNHFKIYVCGPTVYDYFHIGNGRAFVVYDTLRRYLEYKGYQVTYVQNFTDIDDKVIHRANEEGIPYSELADRMIKEYFVDADGLGVKRATIHPKATDCMDDIIGMINTLDEKGFTYLLDDGVYFETAKFPDYGKLSHREQDEEETQSRVSHNQKKRSPSDFVLWKFKKEGEPAWDSPWGEGRPGWHIECSAMNKKFLGDTVDIHGGGLDLTFPHHENEIAQSEAANDAPFVRYWMHNGFINVGDAKMSKSEGNFSTVRDISNKFPYSVLRFFLLQAHYRMPVNFTHELVEAAQKGWQRIQNFAENLEFILNQDEKSECAPEEIISELCEKCHNSFDEGMDDDLNTADAFGALFTLVREVNTLMAEKTLSHKSAHEVLDLLVNLLGVLGLNPLEKLDSEIPAEILRMAEERTQAKKARDFATADYLRDEITKRGWRVDDTGEGTRLSKI